MYVSHKQSRFFVCETGIFSCRNAPYARDSATSIIWVKEVCRSWAPVASPVTMESDMVRIVSALAPAAAALAYRAAASISTASTPMSCHP